MLRLGERARRVLLSQDAIKGVRHQHWHALELRLPQRVDVPDAIAVVVLAAPHTRLRARVRLAQAGDVDEEPVADVDPAGIDDIPAVAADPLHREAIHVQQVLARDRGPVLGRGGVVVQGHVQVGAQPGQRRARDLGVEVPVPGHDLAIPPPAQQRAVGDPGLDVARAEDGQVGADEVVERVAALLIADGLAGEVAPVVVA